MQDLQDPVQKHLEALHCPLLYTNKIKVPYFVQVSTFEKSFNALMMKCDRQCQGKDSEQHDSFMFLTSTNRKHGTMELLLFTPGFPSIAILLSVSVNFPLTGTRTPYPAGNRVSQVSPLTDLRSSPECETKWNPIRTNKLWIDLGKD